MYARLLERPSRTPPVGAILRAVARSAAPLLLRWSDVRVHPDAEVISTEPTVLLPTSPRLPGRIGRTSAISAYAPELARAGTLSIIRVVDFPNQLVPRVARVVSLGRVEVPNTSDVRWALGDDGHRWVRKHVEQCGYEAILAEVVAWLIGRAIGVPMPDAAVNGTGDDLSWLSSSVPDATHWDPARAHLVSNADSFGRALALDAVIFNEDRHARNILLQAVDETHVTCWAIDCDHARIGWPNDFAALGDDEVPSTRNLATGLPADLLGAGATAGARALAGLSRDSVGAFVAEACGITGDPHSDLLTKALLARMARAVNLTHKYLRAIGAAP